MDLLSSDNPAKKIIKHIKLIIMDFKKDIFEYFLISNGINMNNIDDIIIIQKNSLEKETIMPKIISVIKNNP